MNPPSSGLGSFRPEGPDVSPGKGPGADRRVGGKQRDPGALRRLLSVFHAPGRTFAELARSPTIAAALIATALAGAFEATAVSRATDLDAMARHAGGFLGAGVGAGLRLLAPAFWPALPVGPPPLLAFGVAFAFSVSVGVVFGIYPAVVAARREPWEALRSE